MHPKTSSKISPRCSNQFKLEEKLARVNPASKKTPTHTTKLEKYFCLVWCFFVLGAWSTKKSAYWNFLLSASKHKFLRGKKKAEALQEFVNTLADQCVKNSTPNSKKNLLRCDVVEHRVRGRGFTLSRGRLHLRTQKENNNLLAPIKNSPRAGSQTGCIASVWGSSSQRLSCSVLPQALAFVTAGGGKKNAVNWKWLKKEIFFPYFFFKSLSASFSALSLLEKIPFFRTLRGSGSTFFNSLWFAQSTYWTSEVRRVNLALKSQSDKFSYEGWRKSRKLMNAKRTINYEMYKSE